MSDITLHPDADQTTSLLNGNRGLIIAIIVVVIALVVGFFAFFNSTSTGKLQGLIEKVQIETQNLQKK